MIGLQTCFRLDEFLLAYRVIFWLNIGLIFSLFSVLQDSSFAVVKPNDKTAPKVLLKYFIKLIFALQYYAGHVLRTI